MDQNSKIKEEVLHIGKILTGKDLTSEFDANFKNISADISNDEYWEFISDEILETDVWQFYDWKWMPSQVAYLLAKANPELDFKMLSEKQNNAEEWVRSCVIQIAGEEFSFERLNTVIECFDAFNEAFCAKGSKKMQIIVEGDDIFGSYRTVLINLSDIESLNACTIKEFIVHAPISSRHDFN